MGTPKKNSKRRNSSKKRETGFMNKIVGWTGTIWSGTRTIYDNGADDTDVMESERMDRNANRRFILGFLLLILSFCIFVATISYLFTGKADQILMNDDTLPAQNLLGRWCCSFRLLIPS